MKENILDDSNQNRSDFITKFLAEQSIPAESLNRFASIPWTNRWILNPAYKSIPTFCRYLKHRTGEDFFFSRTINTPETIPHMVSLVLKDLRTPAEGSGSIHVKSAGGTLSDRWQSANSGQPDLVVLVEFGQVGVNGHPSVVHGGISSAILDETMSYVIMLHSNHLPQSETFGGTFTANLNINFRAPVTSPGQVVVKCWLLGRERRKWFTRGVIVDKDDKVLVEGEAIWVRSKVPRL